jgi:hypothetical protein
VVRSLLLDGDPARGSDAVELMTTMSGSRGDFLLAIRESLVSPDPAIAADGRRALVALAFDPGRWSSGWSVADAQALLDDAGTRAGALEMLGLRGVPCDAGLAARLATLRGTLGGVDLRHALLALVRQAGVAPAEAASAARDGLQSDDALTVTAMGALLTQGRCLPAPPGVTPDPAWRGLPAELAMLDLDSCACGVRP